MKEFHRCIQLQRTKEVCSYAAMCAFYEENELLQIIRDHNSEIFTAETNLKIIQRYRFFKSDTFGAKVEVDADFLHFFLYY